MVGNISKAEIVCSAYKQFVWGYDDSDKEYKMTMKEYVKELLLKQDGKEVTFDRL